MALARALATIGGFTMMSRLLGSVRDIILAAVLGTGAVADAFFVSLQLPNLFRSLFAEGAFNAAFVPMFTHRLKSEGQGSAQAFAEAALAILLPALLIFCGAFMIGMPYVMLVLAPGFQTDPAKFDLVVHLTRLTFPYLVFISLASLLGGLLNSLGRFAIAAAAQIFFNLCIIAAALIGRHFLPPLGPALAWGVTISGMLQFLWLAHAVRKQGYALALRRPRLSADIRRMLALILPAAVGAGATQISVLVNLTLASLLPGGSVAYLFYADRLNQLPLGVIGVALGTALLPSLSAALAAKDDAGAIATQNRAIELGLALTIPAAAALITIPTLLISMLFERGAFGPDATSATADALRIYALGLPAFVIIRALVPGFHARQDTRTPVRIALVSVGTGIAINLILMWPLKHVGLALGASASAWVQVVLLAVILKRRNFWIADARLKSRIIRILSAAAIMAALLYAGAVLLWPMFGPGFGMRAFGLVLLVLGGVAVYGVAAHLTGALRLRELTHAEGQAIKPPTSSRDQ